MAPTRKRPRRGSRQMDNTNGPTVNSTEDQTDGNSTAPSGTPVVTEATNEDRLEHARKLARNQVSAAYASYKPPQLSDQLEKFNCRMIAWQCVVKQLPDQHTTICAVIFSPMLANASGNNKKDQVTARLHLLV
ncbi:hypothetical protein PCASD_03521 [Puccinia coronata f. sp. avenae]|uniref:Uncharacterized protein n=1 Tax=Puccinia coronata f. sp. avenae TaxID=200324 RepID=A0A2N5V7Q6_9BASI|nr:hypothetical protein PCASD_03521 [Puccinia coronata f. sp. avenae]